MSDRPSQHRLAGRLPGPLCGVAQPGGAGGGCGAAGWRGEAVARGGGLHLPGRCGKGQVQLLPVHCRRQLRQASHRGRATGLATSTRAHHSRPSLWRTSPRPAEAWRACCFWAGQPATFPTGARLRPVCFAARLACGRATAPVHHSALPATAHLSTGNHPPAYRTGQVTARCWRWCWRTRRSPQFYKASS